MNYPVARDLKPPLILTPLGQQFLKIWMVWYSLVDSQPTMILEEVSVKISIKSFQLVQSDITLCYERESESLSVMSYSLQPCGQYSPWNSPGQNTGGGSLLSPGDLPSPDIQPRSPALQADSLPAEPQENTGVGSLSNLQGIFPP